MRTRGAAVLILSGSLAGGCGLLLGSGDYAVGITSTGTGAGGSTGGASSTSSESSASSGAGTGGSSAHTVLVSPATTTLLEGTTQTFSATIDGVPSTEVTWSLVEPMSGSVSPGGAYTTSTNDGTYHLRATSVATPGAHGDATITVARLVTPVALASAGMASAPTGNGTQSHLAYASLAGEWWLFYNGLGGTLLTMHSKDFVTWQPGETLPLAKGATGDGRDLAVASAVINGHDIVHITQGYQSAGKYGRFHIRAAATTGHLTFDKPFDVNFGGDSPPDGASTVILPDGTVLDSTGWEPTPSTPPLSPCGNGDVDVYTADAKEDGTTSFTGVGFQQQVLWCVGNHVNARQLLAVGQTVVHLYEDGENDASPMNVLMSLRTPMGAWLPTQPASGKVTPPSVFSTNEASGLDDWTGTVAGGKAQAVRRLGGTFEHRVLDSNNDWTDGAPIPDEPTLADSGLFLAPYGDGMVLVALSADGGSKVRYTAFSGASWSGWHTLVSTMTTSAYLGGFAPPPPARPAVIWTETGSVDGIAGALLP
jgi:hypothetical protein